MKLLFLSTQPKIKFSTNSPNEVFYLELSEYYIEKIIFETKTEKR